MTFDSSLRCSVGAATDIGRVRRTNEDYFGIFPQARTEQCKNHLFVVADGIGGLADGEKASRIAVTSVGETYFGMPEAPMPVRLRIGFERANNRILRETNLSESQQPMGTTCTAVAISGDQVAIAHLGDSSAYYVTGDQIKKLTVDHTLAQYMADEAGARHHPMIRDPRAHHMLTKALGIDAVCEPEIGFLEGISDGDTFVLCSDGLSSLSRTRIASEVRDREPQVACDALIQLANDNGGHDNSTVVVVRFRAAA